MSEPVLIRCRECGATNRVPRDKVERGRVLLRRPSLFAIPKASNLGTWRTTPAPAICD
jgi:hypothetical protein